MFTALLVEFKFLTELSANNNENNKTELTLINQPSSHIDTQQLLATGFKLFKTGFREIWTILLTQTLSLLVLFVVLFGITISFFGGSSITTLPTEFVVSLFASILIILLVQLGFIASFTTKFWAIAHGHHSTSSHAYGIGIKKALPLLIWLLLYVLIIWTGLFLLFVPGIILGTTLFMGAALIIQDHHSVPHAFRASHKMVWPYLRVTLFYLLVSAGITLGLYFITLYPLGLFLTYLTTNLPMLHGILDIARYALIVMLVPLFVALIIPFYMELLKRNPVQTS